MLRFAKYSLVAMCLFAVSACAPSRNDADRKLLKACKAAVEIVSPTGEVIHKITAQKFTEEKAYDGLILRVVTIEGKVTIGNGPYRKRSYTCYFEEKQNIFKIGYSVDFYRLDRDGRIYGNVDGTIMGDFEDNLKINSAVEGILY